MKTILAPAVAFAVMVPCGAWAAGHLEFGTWIIHIEGAVATPPPGHEHTSPADKAGFRAAVNKWLARIAREVGRAYSTKTEREAAEKFARSHRLSIAHAFTRRLVRPDVVRELARLFEQSKGDHSIQVYNSEEQSIG